MLAGVGTYPDAINSAVLANLGRKEGLGPTSPGWLSLVPVSREPFSPRAAPLLQRALAEARHRS